MIKIISYELDNNFVCDKEDKKDCLNKNLKNETADKFPKLFRRNAIVVKALTWEMRVTGLKFYAYVNGFWVFMQKK